MERTKFRLFSLLLALLVSFLIDTSNAKPSSEVGQAAAAGMSSSEETGGIRAAPLRAVAKKLHEQDMAEQQKAAKQLEEYMKYYNERTRQMANQQTLADWAYSTNINDQNAARKNKMSAEFAAWQRQEWKTNLTTIDLKVLDSPGNERLKRLFQMVEVLGTPALDDSKYNELTGVITNMTSIYSSAKVCPFDNPNCDILKDKVWALQPELDEILTKSLKPTDYDLLVYVWEKWHAVSGKKVRQDFIKYVQLINEAAVANRIPSIRSGADLYLHPYESGTFQEEVAKLYEELRPFYQELHAFVRFKLRNHYGADRVDEKGPIPAHLLGNMWAQSWGALFPIVSEFTGSEFDESGAMKTHNYTVEGMFKKADGFFASLGLVSLDKGAPQFYQNSMLQKPADGREVVCHASAWDMYASNELPGDFRIKMCTVVTFDDFVTVHHELGHIQYYMQYVHQPPLFREGANPGFHEAIGDTLALSVATPKHLKSIGLMDAASQVDKNAQLAFLLKMALEKIAFLPFGYILDLYRWKVFDGSIKFDNLNSEWWKLREEYQGVKPPVPRSEEDFDPGAKYHVVDDVEYLRYFVAHILQFAFHQSMCEAASQFNPRDPDEKPLHECDVGGSMDAGKKLGTLMQAGSSRHWKEVLFEMTGSREMTVRPLLNYFKPLRDYLKDYISRNDVHVGWSPPAEGSNAN